MHLVDKLLVRKDLSVMSRTRRVEASEPRWLQRPHGPPLWFDAVVKSRILPIVSVFLIVMGLIFGAAAVVLTVQTSAFLASAQPTTGVVTALDKQRVHTSADESTRQSERTRRGRYTYHPVVTFDVDGEQYTFTGRAGSDPPSYDVGEQVDVLYNPVRPDEGRIAGGFGYWLEVSFGVAAVVLVVVGGVLLVVRARSAARRRRADSAAVEGDADRAARTVIDTKP